MSKKRISPHTPTLDLELSEDALLKALEILKEQYPTMFWVPNVAQERFCHAWRESVYGPKRNQWPSITLCTLANGTGKTNLMVQDIAGTCLGPRYVNSDWLNVPLYDDIRGFRDIGKLKLRLVCEADDMKENGSAYQEISEWIPVAVFRNKDSAGCYRQIQIPHPQNPNVYNTIDVKTFDQRKKAHAGPTLQRIWMNEPPSHPIWGETIARTRAKLGEPAGSILVFATVLDEAGYLYDLADSDHFRENSVHIEGSTWENCVGAEIPDQVAVKLGLKKDKHGWITRGVLTRDSIDRMVVNLAHSSPEEVEARLWGRPMSLGGVVYKMFSTETHVVKQYPIPEKYPVVQVVDPHDRKPDFSGWFMLTPMRQIIAIREDPENQYELMKSRGGDIIAVTCQRWHEIEAAMGIAGQIVMRYGDPNKMLDPDPNTGQTLQALYASHGFTFNVFINDKLELGHRKVAECLWYNREQWLAHPEDPKNRPILQFMENCRNLIRAMQKYGYKAQRDPTMALTSQLDQKYKDPADVVRYAAVARDQVVDREITPGGKTDYERIQDGRDPYRKSMSQFGGRKVARTFTMM